ncbi:hypothetical protein SB717_36490, partial [Priestia sp. SIMBA_032]|uniref:hypothetical protein n=1 Tax=Priestia sp. SIMBA_032 TaxID=3085775 RepID=UPI00397A0F7A
ANENLPKVSNWWGLLTIPVVSWFVLSIIQKGNLDENNEYTPVSKSQRNGFIGAFLFGVIITALFYSPLDIQNYFLLLTFLVALFLPIY